MSIFTNVKFFIKQLCIAITLKYNIGHSIAIVLDLDSLYNNFITIMTTMLKYRDKIIEKYNKYWSQLMQNYFANK